MVLYVALRAIASLLRNVIKAEKLKSPAVATEMLPEPAARLEPTWPRSTHHVTNTHPSLIKNQEHGKSPAQKIWNNEHQRFAFAIQDCKRALL